MSIKGSIVNVASNAGKVGFPGQCDYNAAKAAVINLTRSLAMEFAPIGINVNAVCPGAVETEMLSEVAKFIVETNGQGDAVELMHSFAPSQLGRLVQPEEVGAIVAFLASQKAAIIRGQSINLDGGATPY
jgi:NAD(P)-dependent dehydrogenase (short-subunit alcohol dehydrogenase family)